MTAQLTNSELGSSPAAQPMKQCTKCREWKPATAEYFYRRSARKSGLQPECKACSNIYNKEWKAAQRRELGKPPRVLKTPEELRSAKRERYLRWAAAHPEEVKERRRQDSRAYYQRNRERINARKKERQAVRNPRPAPVAIQLDPMLQQKITAFLNAKRLRKASTFKWYSNILRRFGEFCAQNGLQQWPVDADSVNAHLAGLAEKGRKEHTLYDEYRAIAAWIRWLIRRGQCPANVLDLIEKPGQPATLPKVVKPEDMERLLATLEEAARTGTWRDVRDRAVIMLALDSGARIGELAGLTLDKLNLPYRVFMATGTKTNEDRAIVFSDQAASALEDWLILRRSMEGGVSFVFVGKPPAHSAVKPLGTTGMRNILARWLAKAGLDHFNFHRLRNSYAVYALRAGADVLDVQKQMGHSNLSTTQIYTRIDDTGRQERHNERSPLGYLLSKVSRSPEGEGGLL